MSTPEPHSDTPPQDPPAPQYEFDYRRLKDLAAGFRSQGDGVRADLARERFVPYGEREHRSDFPEDFWKVPLAPANFDSWKGIELWKSPLELALLEGDTRHPERLFPVDRLAELDHPWLVIEDSHTHLERFLGYLHEHGLEPGDYVVVEDTNPYIREHDETGGRSVRGYGAFGIRKSDRALLAALNAALATFIGSAEHSETVRPFGFTEHELPGDATAAELCSPAP